MTLILTAANSRFVVQVSDRRLTYPNGETYDDEANKAVVLQCQAAKLAFAYTGLGYIGPLRTDEWLVEVLIDAKAGEKAMHEVVGSLAQSATRGLSALPPPDKRTRLAFVLAGWDCSRASAVSPIVCCVSNYHGKDWQTLQEVMPVFEARFACLKGGADPHRLSSFFVHGAADAFLAACGRRVRKFTKILPRQGHHEIVAKLVSLVRATAQHPDGQTWVGRSCMSTVVAKDLAALTCYHPSAGPTAESYVPHSVGPMFSTMHGTIWVGEGEPPWWSKPPPLHR